MKTWVRRTARVGILSAGFLLMGATAASASTTAVTAGNDGVANGNQVVVPVQVPANVTGNGVGALIGAGVGTSANSGAVANQESARAESTNLASVDNDGVANGNQVVVPVQVPVNVAGNGVGVAGVGVGTAVNSGSVANQESASTESANLISAGNDGVLNGNQVYAPIQVPINVCGNGVGVLGLGVGTGANCGAAASQESASAESIDMVSAGNDGVLNGNQVAVPIQVPINVCGNGVGVLGAGIGTGVNCGAAAISGGQDHDGGYHSMSGSTEGAEAAKPASQAPMSTDHVVAHQSRITAVSADNDGVANGNQVIVPVQVPVNIAGNGVGVLGVGVGTAVNSAAVAAMH